MLLRSKKQNKTLFDLTDAHLKFFLVLTLRDRTYMTYLLSFVLRPRLRRRVGTEIVE